MHLQILDPRPTRSIPDPNAYPALNFSGIEQSFAAVDINKTIFLCIIRLAEPGYRMMPNSKVSFYIHYYHLQAPHSFPQLSASSWCILSTNLRSFRGICHDSDVDMCWRVTMLTDCILRKESDNWNPSWRFKMEIGGFFMWAKLQFEWEATLIFILAKTLQTLDSSYHLSHCPFAISNDISLNRDFTRWINSECSCRCGSNYHFEEFTFEGFENINNHYDI